MTEDAPAPDHELTAQIFAVGDESHCVWDWDLPEKNAQFLRGLDPLYFDYVARTNAPNLKADDPAERRRAAITIRIAYHHGLESFFALMFAVLQAPGCVGGWMQVYRPAVLRKLVGSVEPWLAERESRDELRAYRDKALPLVWVRPRHYLWSGLPKVFVRPTREPVQVADTQKRFADLWSRFAKDFLRESFADEYNGLKHGLRANFGGFRLSLGPEESPGEPTAPEQMRLMGASEHGSSFFMRRTLREDPGTAERRSSAGARYFRLRRKSLNWDPKGLCNALSLVSISIYNLRSYAQKLIGESPDFSEFLLPADGAFEEPMGEVSGPQAFDMDLPVFKEDVRLLGREELKEETAKHIEGLREKLDPREH